MSHDPLRSGAADELAHVDDRIIGTAFKWSMLVFALIGAGVVVALVARSGGDPEPVVIERPPVAPPDRLTPSTPELPSIPFTDITTGSGIQFVHETGATGEKLLPETMGGGVAFLDYDDDGDQDLLLVNAGVWPDADDATADAATTALYRNDGRGQFEDVTAAAGLDARCYGMGVAVGDYDADGDEDVYLTTFGPNRLYRNDGGVFRDVTTRAAVGGDPGSWSTSAGFFDADNDGDLDLFVANYVQWTRALNNQLAFTLNGTDRAYGPPKQYAGAHCVLYRNEGDGTFTDTSEASGIRVTNPATGSPMAKTLGVTFVDLDGVNGLDVIVANDTVQNFVFRNRGDGTFEEIGAASGIAFDGMGSATGAMGIDAEDFGNNGRIGIGIGNFANESTSFYVQQDDAWQFADMAGAQGIGSPSRLRLSFGLFMFDADLDGRLDVLQANGHLEEEINAIQPSQHYRQAAQIFWNAGGDGRVRFETLPEALLGDLTRPIAGRGAAYADIDGDGDLDVVLTQVGGAPLLLRNDQTRGHHWLRVRLRDRGGNPDAIGAVVEATVGSVTQRRRVMPTRSYLSQVELPVTFGIGHATRVDHVRVRWPDGGVTAIDAVEADRLLEIERPEE
ncbi:MAG: CRTAC1 family protein [Phycisphaerales bacterium]|nr:CRTAC1 family protein [Phycisphaerae bacterium]NNF42212.1 CRTAC1 family protein [Phycisphaerales bacterium]NNM27590.1 CRTAC1 family protein [Phycisphaerales bacterium]